MITAITAIIPPLELFFAGAAGVTGDEQVFEPPLKSASFTLNVGAAFAESGIAAPQFGHVAVPSGSSEPQLGQFIK